MADCMDMHELVVGEYGLAIDEQQHVVAMSLREIRVRGVVCTLIHIPTPSMIADALAKLALFTQLRCTTSGLVIVA